MLQWSRHCHVAGRGYLPGGGSLAPAAGGLLVFWVRQGAWFFEGGRQMPESGFLLCGGRATLRGPGQGAPGWLELGGAVPAEYAAALRGPTPLAAAQAPGAEELAAQLMEGKMAAVAAEESAAAYALLCRLDAARAGEPNALVAAAMAEVQENYGRVYGVAELAEQLGVSKAHLIRTFTACTAGITPGRYLARVRVENARRLLLHAGLGLETVAGMCGFSDANYLCKVFRRHTGETPTQYRRRMKGTRAANTLAEEQLYL